MRAVIIDATQGFFTVITRQISALTLVVLACFIGLVCDFVAFAADAVPVTNGAKLRSEPTSTHGPALNLGKQANLVEGELRGVAGYTKYAAEVVGVGANDWAQWGGSSLRNNTPDAKNIPTVWNPG